jgi:hypothetical protein
VQEPASQGADRSYRDVDPAGASRPTWASPCSIHVRDSTTPVVIHQVPLVERRGRARDPKSSSTRSMMRTSCSLIASLTSRHDDGDLEAFSRAALGLKGRHRSRHHGQDSMRSRMPAVSTKRLSHHLATEAPACSSGRVTRLFRPSLTTTRAFFADGLVVERTGLCRRSGGRESQPGAARRPLFLRAVETAKKVGDTVVQAGWRRLTVESGHRLRLARPGLDPCGTRLPAVRHPPCWRRGSSRACSWSAACVRRCSSGAGGTDRGASTTNSTASGWCDR